MTINSGLTLIFLILLHVTRQNILLVTCRIPGKKKEPSLTLIFRFRRERALLGRRGDGGGGRGGPAERRRLPQEDHLQNLDQLLLDLQPQRSPATAAIAAAGGQLVRWRRMRHLITSLIPVSFQTSPFQSEDSNSGCDL